MDTLSYFGYFLVARAPILLLMLVGMVFSLIRWQRHPRVSLLTVIGLSFFFIEMLIFAIALYQLPFIFESLKVDYASSQTYHTVLSVLQDFAYAFVIVLLVSAAFSQRQVQTANKTP